MGFDFIKTLVFPVLCVQLHTFHVKGKRVTVDAVQVIFFTGDQPAVFIQDWFHGIFVILEHEITLGFPVICIFTGDVFQNGHGRRFLSARQGFLQRGNGNPRPVSKLHISFHKYPQSPGGLLSAFPGNGCRRC